jgi:hypothetical protein
MQTTHHQTDVFRVEALHQPSPGISMKKLLARIGVALKSFFRREQGRFEVRMPKNRSTGIDRDLLSKVLESEISLGLVFACIARDAYEAGEFERARDAHSKVERNFWRASRLAAEIHSSREEVAFELCKDLRTALDTLSKLRDRHERMRPDSSTI